MARTESGTRAAIGGNTVIAFLEAGIQIAESNHTPDIGEDGFETEPKAELRERKVTVLV